MIGTLDQSQRSVTVIGGGISGLLIAYTLDQLGYEVTLHEAQNRVGGLISTVSTPLGIAEGGAHSVLVSGEVKNFLDELDIQLVEVQKDSKARYILRDAQPRRMPLKFFEIIRTIIRVLFVRSRGQGEAGSMNVAQWAERFLGLPAKQYLMAPMVRGVYGARLEDLSMDAAFPVLSVPQGHSLASYLLSRVMQKRKASASLSAGSAGLSNSSGPSGSSGSSASSGNHRAKMMSARDGMESVVRQLESQLRVRLKDRLVLNSSVHHLPQTGNCILATPAYAAATLLEGHDARLAEALRKIRYTPIVCTTVFVRKSNLSKVPQGVGVLMPEVEKSHCLGILFNSSSFENRVKDPNEWISLSVLMGGSSRSEVLQQSDSEIRNQIKEELVRLWGLKNDDFECVIRRREKAIPQYGADLLSALELARQGWCSVPGRILFGNYTGKVSLRGMVESVLALRAMPYQGKSLS